VENTGDVLARSRRPGFGPVAGSGRSATPLSRARSTLLDVLRAQDEPVTLSALAGISGLHVNTVREHLEALLRLGLARRHAAEPHGRGRPAWLYRASGADEPPAAEYAGLAAALAASIHRTSDSPTQDAVAAGTEWGRRLAGERDARPAEEAAARREVVALLDDLGFASQSDSAAAAVRLTRCPLLEAAHQYPDVVCGVHLGLVRGALAEYGTDPEGTELLPFAEPGACLLHLAGAR
jgi:predicted ArsR family transcriptional regulator